VVIDKHGCHLVDRHIPIPLRQRRLRIESGAHDDVDAGGARQPGERIRVAPDSGHGDVYQSDTSRVPEQREFAGGLILIKHPYVLQILVGVVAKPA
jgi:hypothetical protein